MGLGAGSALAGRENYRPEKVTAGLGKDFRFDLVDTKVFPCHSLQQRPLEAALHLVKENGISSADVDEVVVDVNPSTAHEIDLLEPPDGEHTRVSLQHGIAGALLGKRVGRDTFSDEKRLDPAFREARWKVKIVPHPDWNEPWPGGFEIVTIRLKNGQEHSARWEAWRGYHKTPLTHEELVAKFRDATGDVLSSRAADRAIELTLNLDALKDVAEIMHILTSGER